MVTLSTKDKVNFTKQSIYLKIYLFKLISDNSGRSNKQQSKHT